MFSTFVVPALLISVRLLPLLVVMPVAVFSRVPVFVRGILALAFGIVLAAGLPQDTSASLSPASIFSEFLAGMMLAFGIHVAIAALDMAGRLIDTQIGLNASGVFDPATSNVVGIVAEFFSLGFLMLFVTLDLHHVLLRAVSQMLVVLPPGKNPMPFLSTALLAQLGQQFLAAFLLASPVVFGLWLTDVAFAFLSRSMPQANIYFLALPVKLGLGLLLLILSLPLIVQGMSTLFLRSVAPLPVEALP
jgi:flagellar biosynthetic protein FliR